MQPEYVLGIVGVETYFGRLMGRYRVLDALATLAFDYPARGGILPSRARAVPAADARVASSIRRRRSDPTPVRWARRSSCPRASRHFAVDENGAGHRDLWTDWADIFAQRRQLPAAARLGIRPTRDGGGNARHGAGTHAARPRPRSTTTLGALRARGMQVSSLLDDATACLVIAAPLSRRHELSSGFPQFLRDHALQPQPAVRDGGQRPGAGDRRARSGAGRALMRRGSAESLWLPRLAHVAGAPARARRAAAPAARQVTAATAGQRAGCRAARRAAQHPRQSAVLRRQRSTLYGPGQRRQLRRARRGLLVRARISRATTPRAASATTCTA